MEFPAETCSAGGSATVPRARHGTALASVDSSGSGRPSLYKSVSTPGKDITSNQNKAQIKRTQSIKERITNETAKFFGLAPEDASDGVSAAGDDGDVRVVGAADEAQKWQQRRFRHLKREYGIRMDALADEMQPKIGIDALPYLTDDSEAPIPTPTASTKRRLTRLLARSAENAADVRVMRNQSARCTGTSMAAPTSVETRQSVAQMALDAFRSILQGSAFRRVKRRNSIASSAVRGGSTGIGVTGDDGSVTVLGISDADTYCPIRQRKAAGAAAATSFSAVRPPIAVGRLEQADATVRQISEFFVRSLPSRVTVAADEITAMDVERIEGERDRHSFNNGLQQRAPSLTVYNTMPISASRRRPSYLPLSIERIVQAPEGRTPPRDVAAASGTRRSSVTADDLFFDMTSTHPLPNERDRSSTAYSLASASLADCSSGRIEAHRFAAYRSGRTLIVRQNSYELEDYATPMSDGLRSPIYAPAPPFRPSAPPAVPLHAVGYRNGLRKEEKEMNAPTSALSRRFHWLKTFGRSDASSGSSEYNFRSFMKFQFSTRNGYSATASGEASSSAVAGKSSKRSLPIFGSINPEIARQLRDESCDYRPFFTFWITTVQVVVMMVMLMRYGIGTDFSPAYLFYGVIERSGDVTSTFLSMSHIVVWEQNNLWIGPRFADLVHAGAKYTPCMRQDADIHAQILAERREEAGGTGCCIGAEGGCFQGSECPKQFARLVKWSTTESDVIPSDSIASSSPIRIVCGQDPRYCLRPKSLPPFEWNRIDISTWPVCEESRPSSLIPRRAEHMHCTITGRPCCIQMHGQCRITTPDYCAFVGGYYHANATLCSQVSCLNSVCGMTPFLSVDRPDQIYRLITPLFMHAGIIRCAISVALQMGIMRNFEVMIGWLRLSIIYFVSGIGGYLASAVFVPYMPEVGPAGSQGGVLGALIVNVLYNWHFLRRPARTLSYHLAITAALFLTGLLPFVDNWAQLFGFLFGCLLAAALIPYIVFGKSDVQRRRRRMILVCGALAATALLFIILFAMFYVLPATSFAAYDLLRLVNCPFSGKVCDQQGLFLRSWLPI